MNENEGRLITFLQKMNYSCNKGRCTSIWGYMSINIHMYKVYWQ